jgi:hypothetical protein
MEKEICILKNFRNILDATTDTDCTDLDNAIKTIEYDMKPKTYSLCIFWDTAKPRSHPNYTECNNRKYPLSYMKMHYEFGCKMFVPKDNA